MSYYDNSPLRARIGDSALARRLSDSIQGEVLFDAFNRGQYSTDASIYQIEPVGVVVPEVQSDLDVLIAIAAEEGVPLLPRGAGTSQSGQTVGLALVVDVSKHLNSLIDLDLEGSTVTVEPGIVLDQLNRELAPHGMMYAPDPTTSSRACVGGGIGNNTCGAHSVIYGKSLDHILEVDAILADGTQTHFRNMEAHELEAKLSGTGLESDIYRGVRNISQRNIAEIKARYPNIMRRVSGYNLDEVLTDDPFNLTKMVVGSEGTLCVVTEAKVNLVPRPTMTALSILHFSDIVRASEAIVEVLRHEPSSIEVMDNILLQRSRESLGHSGDLSFIQGDPGALLAVEFYGDSEGELVSKTNTLKRDIEGKGLAYACVNILDLSLIHI